ncbi:MAG: DUF308 domain-containing protein [Defluviitaleaceae bacterium]|nr:DUF308 domain-containing protein [Defluviitaleaceae bacterium]
MEKVMKVAKWLLPISGFLVVVLGVVMIFVTIENLDDLSIFIGLAMILSGISEFVSYKRKTQEKRTKTMLLSGIIAVLLGLFTIFGRGIIVVEFVLPIIFAAWIISGSIPRIKNALARRAQGSPVWIFMFVFGVLGIALALLLIFHSMLAAFVVTYALVFMFITHGINTIIMFMPIKLKLVNKSN